MWVILVFADQDLMIGRQLSKEDRSVRATDGMGKHHQADSESTVSGKEIRRKERMEVPEVQHLGGVPEVMQTKTLRSLALKGSKKVKDELRKRRKRERQNRKRK